MKWYGILLIIILIGSVVLFVGYFTDFENVFSKKILPKIFEYDCAKNYDETIDIFYTKYDPTQSSNSPNNYEVYLLMKKKSEAFIENSCDLTKESWIYKSKYEGELWASDWTKAVHYNQKYQDTMLSKSDLVDRAMNYYKLKSDGTPCDDDRRWVEDRNACIREERARKIFYSWNLEWLSDHPEYDY